jgi:hypothetical protein
LGQLFDRQAQFEVVGAQPRHVVGGVPGGAEQKPLLVDDLAQDLQVQVVHQRSELPGRPAALVRLAQHRSARVVTSWRRTVCSSGSDVGGGVNRTGRRWCIAGGPSVG